MVQGLKALRLQNWEPLPVEADSIDVVVLTHAQLDHVGYLPRLVREGFRGEVFCSSATADLAEIILLDSAKIQESHAEFANRHGFSKHRPALPLYGKRDAERAIERFRPVAFGTQAGSVVLEHKTPQERQLERGSQPIESATADPKAS